MLYLVFDLGFFNHQVATVTFFNHQVATVEENEPQIDET